MVPAWRRWGKQTEGEELKNYSWLHRFDPDGVKLPHGRDICLWWGYWIFNCHPCPVVMPVRTSWTMLGRSREGKLPPGCGPIACLCFADATEEFGLSSIISEWLQSCFQEARCERINISLKFAPEWFASATSCQVVFLRSHSSLSTMQCRCTDLSHPGRCRICGNFC